MPKQTGKDQMDDLELDGSTTLKILHGLVSRGLCPSEMMEVMEDSEV